MWFRTLTMNARMLEPDDDAPILELWLRGRPPTTRRAYLSDYGLLAVALRKPITQMLPEDLFRFGAEMHGSPATRARRLASLKSLMGFAFRAGFLRQDPARALKLPKTMKSPGDRVLGEDEVVELIKETRPGRDRVLVRTLYISGLRISEAVGLRWRDVGGRWLSVMGKGAAPRTVMIPRQLVAEIRALRNEREPDDGFVFKGRASQPLSAGHARRTVKTAGLEALGRPVAPHDLRHTHACHAMEHGVPLQVLQMSLGHASLSTTAVYLHLRPNQGSSQYLSVGT